MSDSPALHPGTRKIAALLASVDRATAERLLSQLPPERAREALAAARELGTLSEAERRAAIEEFRSKAGRTAASINADESRVRATSDASTDEDAAVELSISPTAKRMSAKAGPPSAFRFLEEASDEELIECVLGESAQVAAMVLAHLSPTRGGRLLQAMPAPARAEATARFSALDDSDVQLAREAETEIAVHLRSKLDAMRKKASRLGRLKEILQAAGLDASEAALAAAETDADDSTSDGSRTVSATRFSMVVGDAEEASELLKDDIVDQHASLEGASSVEASDDDEAPDVLPFSRAGAVGIQRAAMRYAAMTGDERAERFAGLFRMADRSIAEVCERLPLPRLLAAMAGAEPEDVDAFAGMLGKREAAEFLERLADAFPITVDEIDAAQSEALAVAEILIEEGRIESA